MPAMSRRAIIVGIDEAGYGPILGPLVVSATAFAVPSIRADDCLWKVLRASVSDAASARNARIAILDSKKLYSRKDGLARLERSVLAVVRAWRGMPPDVAALVRLLCPQVVSQLDEYPWYRIDDAALPREADEGGIRIAGATLSRDMQAQDIHLAGIWSEVLPEGHYNQLVGNTHNKAVVLATLTLRLIHRIATAHPDTELRIAVDKQGAREHYGPMLMRAFEGRRMKIVDETQTLSAYELEAGGTSWRVSFNQGGEDKHLPIALASLVSKYLRELLMGCFNAYWASEVPALRSTAGYYQDGQRFLKDIAPHIERLGIRREQLVRER